MVYGEVTSTTAPVFNCPPLGYSSANGNLPFLSNQASFFPPTPLPSGYNLPLNRNPGQVPADHHFNLYNNQYVANRPSYPIQGPSSQDYTRMTESVAHNRIETPLDENPAVLPSTSQQPINDPCAHLVQVLLCYHQGGEDPDFIRKAIESLVKKLKDKRTELDFLISAVTSGGKQVTGCVTINRSLDGRLQVAGRKGVPHVVYARIWRWPNVGKNELQKMATCTTPTDHPDLICINPFHYDRIVSSTLGNLDMQSLRMDSFGGSFDQQSTSEVSLSEIEDLFPFNASTSTSLAPNPSTSERKEAVSTSMPFLMYGPHQQPSYVVSHLPCGGTVSSTALPGFLQQFQQQQPEPKPRQQTSEFQIKVDESQNWMPSNQPHDYMREASIPPNHVVFATNDNDSVSQNIFGVKRYDALRYNLDHIHIPPTSKLDAWCSIAYYELDTQIGQTFKVPFSNKANEVTVDGGMDPSGAKLGRFCLGALPNVHRSEASEKARIHIGRGIKLRYTPDGSVYLNCLSLKGVFVRSYFLDFEHGLIYGSVVHKFCVGAEKKIFDLRWAFSEMCEQRQSAQIAVAAQAYAVAGIAQNPMASSLMERAGTGVDDLRRVCCTIAISFVKGWGAGYKNRTTIKETPCWIELQLHRPLQLLNSLLQKTD